MQTRIIQYFYDLLEDGVEYSDKYKKINSEYIEKSTEIKKLLFGEKDTLEKYKEIEDLACELEVETSEIYFEKGFKSGFLFALEIAGFTPPKQ